MAYGTKYTGSFPDYSGNTYTVNLKKLDYTGSTDTIDNGNVSINYRGGREVEDNSIMPSDAVFDFYSYESDNNKFDELFESEYKEWQLEIIKEDDISSYEFEDEIDNLDVDENTSTGKLWDQRIAVKTGVDAYLYSTGITWNVTYFSEDAGNTLNMYSATMTVVGNHPSWLLHSTYGGNEDFGGTFTDNYGDLRIYIEKSSDGGLAATDGYIKIFDDLGSEVYALYFNASDDVSSNSYLLPYNTFASGDTITVEIYEVATGSTGSTGGTFTIYGELLEAVSGSPTWETHFDSDQFNLVGSMSGGPDPVAIGGGTISVSAAAKKTSNGGIAQDAGNIDFIQNGSTVHNIVFAIGANVSNRTYTFTGVAAGDTLEIIITEG